MTAYKDLASNLVLGAIAIEAKGGDGGFEDENEVRRVGEKHTYFVMRLIRVQPGIGNLDKVCPEQSLEHAAVVGMFIHSFRVDDPYLRPLDNLYGKRLRPFFEYPSVLVHDVRLR